MMKKKTSLEAYRYFALIANIVTFVLIFVYIISLSGLRFRRTRSLSVSDFSIETNDFITLKYYFIYPVPLFFIAALSTILFVRICFVHFIVAYLNQREQVVDKIDRTINIVRIIHIIIAMMTTLLLVISLVILSVDFSNCNKPGPNGAASLCTNILYCCANNVLIPPGIVTGCPWIQSCAGVSTPFDTKSLENDLYFVLSFAFNIALVVFMIPHIYFAFYSDDTIICKNDIKSSINTNINRTTGNLPPIATSIKYANIPANITHYEHL